MSLVLKSNKLATNYLGNINGILGKQDWVAFFDFENGEYSKKINGVKTLLTESQVLSSTSNKNLATKPMTQDRLGNKSQVLTTDQIRWWGTNNRYGLLVENEQTNWFANSSAPVSQVISNLAAGSTLVASCIGSGSLVITGSGIETVVVTESSPATIKPQAQSAAITLNVEVVGSLSHVQVVRCAGFATVHSPITTTASKPSSGSDLVEINQPLLSEIINTNQPVTVLVQSIPMFMTQDDRAQFNELRAVIETDTLVAGFGINKTASGPISPRMVSIFKADSTYQSSGSGNIQDYILNEPMTYAIQVGDFGVVTSINGGSLFKASNATGLNKVKRIRLAPLLVSPVVQQGGNCIFTKLAIYNRLLSDAEILQISKSWL